jgi:predicted aspartyl protease
VLAASLVAAPASAELYRWLDPEGIVHYTADLASIPPAARDAAQPIAHPRPNPTPPLTGSGPVSIPMTNGAPVTVTAGLNGVTLTLIVDTGAERTVISPAALERAGLGAEPGRPVRIVGATGEASASLVTVPLLDVAGARIGPLAVIAHTLPADGRSAAADGLLGRDVLDAFTLTVDAMAGRATLTPR